MVDIGIFLLGARWNSHPYFAWLPLAPCPASALFEAFCHVFYPYEMHAQRESVNEWIEPILPEE